LQYRPTVRISIDRQQGSPAALAMRQPISVGAADRFIMIGLEAKRTGAVDWKRGCAGHWGNLEVPKPKVQKRPLSSQITPSPANRTLVSTFLPFSSLLGGLDRPPPRWTVRVATSFLHHVWPLIPWCGVVVQNVAGSSPHDDKEREVWWHRHGVRSFALFRGLVILLARLCSCLLGVFKGSKSASTLFSAVEACVAQAI